MHILYNSLWKGDAISLNFTEISKRVKKILSSGITEIVLTGVDLTSYGEDLKESLSLQF